MRLQQKKYLIGLLALLSGNLLAAERQDNAAFASNDSYAYAGDVWRPLLSKIAPGADQYASGQYAWGSLYTAIGVGAKIWEHDAAIKVDHFKGKPRYTLASDDDRLNFRLQNNLFRERMLAAKTFDVSGDLSAYHSFRTAVLQRQKYGEYSFIDSKNMETSTDLMMAPFQFSYLKRPTTWVPLVVTAAFWATMNNNLPKELKYDSYTGSDAGYAGAMSYEAGVGEEAFWRGYLQPMMREHTNSSLWANVLQSALFMVSHVNGNVYHLGYGYYFGWLNERNGWRLGEGTFLHTWADVISISASYSIQKKTPVLALPAANFVF